MAAVPTTSAPFLRSFPIHRRILSKSRPSSEVVNLDGQDGADTYQIDATADTNYVINVHDSGALDSGLNTLVVNGAQTAHGQTFLLRDGFVAIVNSDGNQAYQRINYDLTITNRLEVNGGAVTGTATTGGNGSGGADGDSFYLDGNAALTTINASPHGDDFFQVGQQYFAGTAGQLVGGTLSAPQQALSNWTGITDGSFHVAIDGAEQNITGLNFSTAASLNDVAAIIETALQNAVADTTVAWDSTNGRFVITSPTRGSSSSVSFLTAVSPTTGTDISAQLRGTAETATSHISGAAAAIGNAAGDVGAGGGYTANFADGQHTFGDGLTTTLTTVGYLSDGVDKATVLYGGGGTDTFEVYSNKADLAMIGGSGDDTFIVRAFLVAAGTHLNVKGGSGNDTIEYAVDAPIDIEGGTGFNQLILLGTEANDTFVVTKDGIFGGGLNVSYSNIQAITIDGLEGNDTFYVLSTPSGVVTTINGGPGGDTVIVGGDVTNAVVSSSTLGASSVFDHSVTSTDLNYDGIFVPGIKLTVGGGGGGAIIDPPSEAIVHVNDPSSTAQFTVNAPKLADGSVLPTGAIVYVVVSPALPSAEFAAQGAAALQVSVYDGTTWSEWSANATLEFVGGGSTSQMVRVRAAPVPANDTYTRPETIVVASEILVPQQAAISNDDAAALEALVLPTIKVTVESSATGLIIDQGLQSQTIAAGPNSNEQTSYTYTLTLNKQPALNETVTVALTGPGGAKLPPDLVFVDKDGNPLATDGSGNPIVQFNSSNWDVEQQITVSSTLSGSHDAMLDDIQHNITTSGSTTPVFSATDDAGDVNVTVAATDTPGVLLLQPQGAAFVSPTQTYTYQMVLTQAPASGDTVTVNLLSDGQVFTNVGAGTVQTVTTGTDAWKNSIVKSITFDSTNWNIPVTVTLNDNTKFTPSSATAGTQPQMYFPNQPHTLAQIGGPLIVDGGTQPGQPALVASVALPYETNNPPVTEPTVVEAAAGIDSLKVYDDGATAGQTGSLTTIASGDFFAGEGDNISGLDLPSSNQTLTFTRGNLSNISFEGGISYVNLDAMQLLLGKGGDNFTIDTTAATLNTDTDAVIPGDSTLTVVEGGGGANTITVTASSDPLVLYGNESAASVEYNSAPGAITGNGYKFTTVGQDTIDASGATNTVVIVGGPAGNTITGGMATSWIAGGLGNDTIHAPGTLSYIFGAGSFTVGAVVPTSPGNPQTVASNTIDLSSRLLTIDNSGKSAGGDTITVTGGNSVVFGDYGTIQIAGEAAAGTLDPFATLGTAADMITLIMSANPTVGGSNTIQGGAGNDILIGGTGDATITGGTGSDIIIGNDGEIDYYAAGATAAGTIQSIESIDPANRGNNTITGSKGNDIIIGGTGANDIIGGSADNIIIGQDGAVTYDAAGGTLAQLYANLATVASADFGDAGTAGANTAVNAHGTGFVDAITGSSSSGWDVIIGGTGNDWITGSASGNDVIVGDNGSVVYNTSGAAVGTIQSISSSAPANGGSDIITGGVGDDIIIGGIGANAITGATGSNVIIGQDGTVTYSDLGGTLAQPLANLATIASADPTHSGTTASSGFVDTISGSRTHGNDIIIGGTGSDYIKGSVNGNDVIVGDNGEVDFLSGTTTLVKTITSTDPAAIYGGNNVIVGGLNGNDVIIGGTGNNTITGSQGSYASNTGNNIIIGQNGQVLYGGAGSALTDLATGLLTIQSSDFSDYGNDTIYGGALRNIIIGGSGDDNIWAGPGGVDNGETISDLIVGDNGQVTMDGTGFGYVHATAITTDFNDPNNAGVSAIDIKGPGRTTYNGTTISSAPVDNIIQGYAPSEATSGPTPTGGGDDILIGGAGNDWISGGKGDDLIFGNNVTLTRGTANDPRFQTLTAATIYTDTATTDQVNVLQGSAGGVFRTQSGYLPMWDYLHIAALDESVNTGNATATNNWASDYGNNYIAGGPGDNMIFGGPGTNAIQGAGSILGALHPVTLAPNQSGGLTLTLNQFTTSYSLTLNGVTIDGISAAATPTAAALNAAITAAGISGVTVSGNAGGPFTITGAAATGYAVNSQVYAKRDAPVLLQVGVDAATGAIQYEMALGALHVNPSFEATTDGNNYIEGGGNLPGATSSASTVIFGGIGQNDIIGGNSDLFTLHLASQRPDSGNVIIFAGAGTEIARNYDELPTGTNAGNAHARNASVIVANNGDIYDLVGNDQIGDLGGFLTYNYDTGFADMTGGTTSPTYGAEYYYHPGALGTVNSYIYDPFAPTLSQTTNYYGGTQFVIPRAVQLLDYVYGGQPFNFNHIQIIGGTAEVHAESGDTQIYGGPNNDTLFGGSGNDQIIGGSGSDWIAAGNGLVASYGGNIVINGTAAPSSVINGNTVYYTGSTGILGGDGRLGLARNSLSSDPKSPNSMVSLGEPLYGIAPLAASQIDQFISTPGKAEQSTINLPGALTYVADLTPANPDPLGASDWAIQIQNHGIDSSFVDLSLQTKRDDNIIYGGLGNTFIHGGFGDDAISGAQALPKFWNNPIKDPSAPVSYDGWQPAINPATGLPVMVPTGSQITNGILQFNGGGATTSFLFSDYNEFAPHVTPGYATIGQNGAQLGLNGFFLNFNQNEGLLNGDNKTYTVGFKALFGDMGHNWIDGANSTNDIYGGFGDDLLNGQRNLTGGSQPGLNDVTDNNAYMHSVIFAGAGRNTLIAGGANDRLIAWRGEFNQYVIPFAPYGLPTVSRDVNPALFAYLYQLSAADGADNVSNDISIADPARNGEPYGELGLVTQVDPFWQMQGGAPNQAVAQGHIPGGSRTVIASASFTNNTLGAVEPVSGTWTVKNGLLNATPPALFTNSFAVFDPNNTLPNYFELTASVATGKPTAGYKSNAYIIFDYQSPSNFKFAGIDESINKVEIGHYDPTQAVPWVIDAQAPAQIVAGTRYNLFLSLNNNYAYLIVNNNASMAVSFLFPWNVVNGVNIGVNYGIVGLGANNSLSSFSNLVIQQPVPPTSFTYTETYTGGTAQYYAPPSSGSWTMAPGSDTGTASTAKGAPSGGAAIQLIDIGPAFGLPAGTLSLQPNATLDLKATLQTTGEAGLVYAYDNPGYYKFAVLLRGTNQVALGHYTSKSGFVFDAKASFTIASGTSYAIEINANGNFVVLKVNGLQLLSYTYNSVLTGGQFGLAVLTGKATFTQSTVFTDDSNLKTETIQHMYAASAPTAAAVGVTSLTMSEVDAELGAAIDRLTAVYSLDAATIAELRAVTIDIAALPDDGLGITVGDTITLSPNAAGWGWFIDPNPTTDDAFLLTASDGLVALPGSAAAGAMDLLTVEMHELAHVLGFADTTSGLMSEYLSTGTRLAPPVQTVLAPLASEDTPATLQPVPAMSTPAPALQDESAPLLLPVATAPVADRPADRSSVQPPPQSVFPLLDELSVPGAASITLPPPALAGLPPRQADTIGQTAPDADAPFGPFGTGTMQRLLAAAGEAQFLTPDTADQAVRLVLPGDIGAAPITADGGTEILFGDKAEASQAARQFAFASPDDVIRAVRDSEISFAVARHQPAPGSGGQRQTWVFDEAAGTFVAPQPEPLTIVVADARAAADANPSQPGQSAYASADEAMVVPSSSWLTALRDFGRVAARAWFET
ncbi:MAG TPA: DUF3383 family protein [Stellaceae bacterium]|nr:DUF3383 family protein [Stellaceae bacterium]